MSQQDLDDSDANALFQELGGETVAKRVGDELLIETTGRSCAVESPAGSGMGQVRGAVSIGEEPLLVAMELPDLPKHGQDRLGQGQGPLLVAFADHPQEHLLGVDGGNGQSDGLADPQAAGVNQRETAAIDRMPDRGNQAAAVLIASNVGKAIVIGLADFFLVSSAQSRPRVLTNRNLIPQ